LLVLAVVVAAVSGTGTAFGKCRSFPKGNPSLKEYVEDVPRICSPKGKKPVTLPPAIVRQLGTGPEAELLRKAATSPEYGAPQTVRRNPGKLSEASRRRVGPNPLAASFGVVTGGSNSRFILLLALMAGIAAVAGGTALYRRRS